MKRLSLYLFLLLFTLQTPSLADDIRDFQIEGMSIGDGLLDYFSEKEINNFLNYDDLPSDMKFRISEFYSKEDMKMDVYDVMQIYYKPEDKKFILHGVVGSIFCSNKNETKCKKTYKNIVSNISSTFENLKGKETTFKHFDDKSGKSIVTAYFFHVNNGTISIKYTDWSNKVKWSDNVSVEALTTEVINWSDDYGVKE